ncbi:hypothetical protein PJS31_004948, partial [Escherichia coli]|nr:hypothetical protein [Escherichia coli]EHB8697339.1 hypothetical protein [Escherichia coli]EHP1852963.1 hypothetical protein [Escherichia coli]EKJ6307070.1 hypothetical protein [Escherichia coli]MCD6908609.1 hypothetical protein [Escherichia coli]
LWFPLLIWWTPLCLIRQILTRRFRLYAYKKVVRLAIQSASQKWTMPLQDWRIAMSRFIIEFGDRLDGHF